MALFINSFPSKVGGGGNCQLEMKKKHIIDRMWDIFSSLSLSIAVFAIIAITSVIGSVIKQRAAPEQNIEILAGFFGEFLAPAVFGILDTLGFTDMFQSWWFIALLCIFAANLIVCSINRLPRIWEWMKSPIRPLLPEHFSLAEIKKELVFKAGVDKDSEAIKTALKGLGFKANVHQGDSGLQVYAEKGRYSRVGVYIAHLSIVLILTGAAIGSLWAVEGIMVLMEGKSSGVIVTQEGEEVQLGFEMKCIDFEATFFERSDIAKSYTSWVTLTQNGSPIQINGDEIIAINVNAPLRFRGITFLQAGHGFIPHVDSLFKFRVIPNDGKAKDVSLKFEESFAVLGADIIGRVIDFSPALAIDSKGRVFTYADAMKNPAALVEFTKNGVLKYHRWILKRDPMSWQIPNGIVEFRGLWGAQYTVLLARKDPGIWLIYLGCLMAGIGLYIAFFVSHRRIWIRRRDKEGSTEITIAASTNKNITDFERKIERLTKGISYG